MLLSALSYEAKKLEELEQKNVLICTPKGLEGRKYEGAWYIYKNNTAITEQDKKWLYEFDKQQHEFTSIHIVYNYKDILSD